MFLSSGYFSLVENGTSTAIAYSTITQLIRDKVFKFVSLNKLQGYTESGAKGKQFKMKNLRLSSSQIKYNINF